MCVIRCGGADWGLCLTSSPTEAEGRGSGEAAPAGGESPARNGASQSPLPTAGRRDGGEIRYRALHAAAETAGRHRRRDLLQVVLHNNTHNHCFQSVFSDLLFVFSKMKICICLSSRLKS